jgi:hypothetical protein
LLEGAIVLLDRPPFDLERPPVFLDEAHIGLSRFAAGVPHAL